MKYIQGDFLSLTLII